LFYSKDISFLSLAIAAGLLGILFLFNRARIFSPIPYAVAGIGLWLAFLQSGVHPTIAGVLLALTIPTRGRADVPQLLAQTDTVLNRYDYSETDEENREQALIHTLKTILDRMEPPAQRMEHRLQPWTTYLILPIFALANAGITLSGGLIDGLLDPVSLGIILGLVVGKPVGISLFAWLAQRLGLAELPRDISWPQFVSASALAGIGFTMSLFITAAAFEGDELLASAKLGILVASLLAAFVGFLALNATSPRYDQVTETPRRVTTVVS
jgi:NhaA family Na+:H+ antiporter